MFKLLKLFIWILLVSAFLIGTDQLLLRLPLNAPGVTQAQNFYVDFRGRLLGLFGSDSASGGPSKSIEEVIESRSSQEKRHPAQQRYLYVDENGALQFADSLELVPARYRNSAQPLAE